MLLLAAPATAVDVPLPSRPVALDGDLREWGEAAWIPVEPAADGVGLRGVFADALDHEAVVLVQWDARHLYVAAAVHDDTLDAGRVPPAEREWHGPAGERKDRMFYYDHMKLFVREPGADAGYNLWFAPPGGGDGGSRPYWWGGRQRRAPVERPPVEVASRVRGRARTFEMAIPWTWLGAWPQPGDEFDALFLFVDADQPGRAVGAKIGSGRDRWIWWQGPLVLRGRPEGLRPRPTPEDKVMKRPVAVAAEEGLDPRVRQAIERSRRVEAEAAAAAGTAAATSPPAAPSTRSRPPAASSQGAAAATAPGPRQPPAPGAPAAAPPSAGGTVAPAGGQDGGQVSLRARLNRQLLARRAASRAPDWMRRLERSPGLSEAQVDSYYTVLRRHLGRIVVGKLSVRVDILVVDMADAAGGGRIEARRFLVDLLRNLEGRGDEEALAWYARAAESLDLEAGSVRAFVEALGSRSRRIFEERRETTSDELLRKAAGEAGLSPPRARQLLGALARIEDGIVGW